MRQYLRTISWKFNDVPSVHPALKGKIIIIKGPEDVFTHFGFLFKRQVRERFVVFWLNSANRITGFEVVTEGILNSSLIHPREVFRGAIVTTCASIILAHNHPSGNPEPSADDMQITRQIVEAGKVLGIPVYDHIIFTDGGYTSLAERGLI